MSRPLHLLVTAGPTRENIDAVRAWSNIFTGKTGLDLALAFLALGNVTLLTSNEEHARQFDGYSGRAGMMGVELFRSHADLRELLAERMTDQSGGGGGGGVDVVAMTAAVADYKPGGVYRIMERRTSTGEPTQTPESENQNLETWVVERVGGGGEGKVKSTFSEMAVRGERTEKLIDLFRSHWGFKGLLIKFKLEVGLSDEELIRLAEASRRVSGADLMVANTLAMAQGKQGAAPREAKADGGGAGVGGDGAGGAYLIEPGIAAQWVSRRDLADKITQWIGKRVKT